MRLHPFDELTPEDLFYGRMVRDLLKAGGTVTIQKRPEFKEVIFSYDTGEWRDRTNYAISTKELDLMETPITDAEFIVEDMLNFHSRKK